jgi:hypothetical protein
MAEKSGLSEKLGGVIMMKHMGIYGRLGNQMFQLAFLTARADEYKMTVQINKPISHLDKSTYSLETVFDLDPYPEKITVNSDIEIQEHVQFAVDPQFRFNKFMRQANIHVHGYFQSFKYFSKDLAQKLFKFKPDIAAIADTVRTTTLCDNNADELAFLHVRLGDYRVCGHFIPGIKYYQRAVSHIQKMAASREKRVAFLVLSDEPEWCRQNFTASAGFPELVFYHNDTLGVEMCVMTKCEHAVIAASSYSWWGAYLRERDGEWIAPHRWFSDTYVDKTLRTVDLSSLLPPDVIRLSDI